MHKYGLKRVVNRGIFTPCCMGNGAKTVTIEEDTYIVPLKWGSWSSDKFEEELNELFSNMGLLSQLIKSLLFIEVIINLFFEIIFRLFYTIHAVNPRDNNILFM